MSISKVLRPVDRIDFLDTKGQTGESCYYYTEEDFLKTVKLDWADVLGAKVNRIYAGYYGTQIEVTGCDPARLEAFSKMLAGECTIAESECWLNPATDESTFELKYDDGGVQ